MSPCTIIDSHIPADTLASRHARAVEQKVRTETYLATIEEKIPADDLKTWRYQEKLWEKNVLTNQDGDYENPYELTKAKGTSIAM